MRLTTISGVIAFAALLGQPNIGSSAEITAGDVGNDDSIVASGLLAAWNLDSISTDPVVTEADAYFMATGLVQSVLTHSNPSEMRGASTALKAIDNDEMTIADAITADNYFYWQIEPQSNFVVSITSIVVRTDTDDNKPTEAFVLSDASGIDAASTLLENGAGAQVGTADLSGRTEFELSSDPIEFRVYGYKDNSQYTALYIGKKYNADNQDDILVYGTVADASAGKNIRINVSPTDLYIPEGSSAPIGISLSDAPASNVTAVVQRTSGDTDISVLSGDSMVFTPSNWADEQIAIIQAAEDVDQNSSTAVITISCDGANPVDLTATERENDIDTLTRLTLSTNVLRSGVNRLGINIADNYWDGPTLKKRAVYNFEGLIYRQVHKGELYTNGFATYWGDSNHIQNTGWDEVYTNGATFRVISGEGMGITGKIVRVESMTVDPYGNGSWQSRPFFVFDSPISVATNGMRDVGLLIEDFSRTKLGYMGETGNYWKSAGTTVITNDRAPGSFGYACARMDADLGATIRMPSFHQRVGDANGDWKLRFWARKESGSPTLSAGADGPYVSSQTVTLSDSWQQYEITLTASGVPTPEYPDNDIHVIFDLSATGSGSVLLDDVEFWQDGHTNATPFTDDAVNTLKELNPGMIRHLRMGGNTVTNAIVPRLKQFGTAYIINTEVGVYAGTTGNFRKDQISIHEQAQLCEEIGADPWFCLPGGVHPDEVSFFTDYLAGSTNTPGGKLRADLGQPTPWTEVFDQIHVEFGNEAWNAAYPYLLGGFNGGNYWKTLISAGKSPASFTTNILFHAAGQNFESGMARSILENTDNADRYAIAPYMLQRIETEDLSHFSNDQELFQWMMAFPLYKIYENGLPQQKTVSNDTDIEYSIYEYNYHITEGDFADTLDTRNKFLTSISHGVSVGNTMLAMLRENNIRSQCFFQLYQTHYNGLRLWGNVISSRADQKRYRPAFLAMQSANKVIAGDLVETVHSGYTPIFTATGDFESSAPVSKTYDELYSYAFKNGPTNSLVIVSYNLTTTRQVELNLPEYVAGNTATYWTLTSSSFTNNNEPTLSIPQVELVENVITNFENGTVLNIPPTSMVTIQWLSEGTIPQIIPSTGALYITEGSSDTVSVVLSSQPATPLTISAAITSQTAADFVVTGGATLSFNASNWNMPQTVTVAAQEDAYGLNGTATLALSAEGYTTGPVTLNEMDDDPAGTNVISGTLLIDFGASSAVTTNIGWNNITSIATGIAVADVKNSDGSSSGYMLEITDAFQYALADSIASDVTYPSSARSDYFRVMSPNTSASVKLTGMNPSMICTVSLLSSGTQNYGSETQFTIDGESKTIDSYYNSSTMVTFSNVSPSVAGEFAIDIDYAGAGIGIINLMQIDYAEPVEPEDSDVDGLPDWWEDMHGYSLPEADPAATAANGINTLQDCYIAGLDPTDPAARFMISHLNPLQWNAVSGRLYNVYWTSNLLTGFDLIESNLTGGVFTDLLHSVSDNGQIFYKLEVQVEK